MGTTEKRPAMAVLQRDTRMTMHSAPERGPATGCPTIGSVHNSSPPDCVRCSVPCARCAQGATGVIWRQNAVHASQQTTHYVQCFLPSRRLYNFGPYSQLCLDHFHPPRFQPSVAKKCGIDLSPVATMWMRELREGKNAPGLCSAASACVFPTPGVHHAVNYSIGKIICRDLRCLLLYHRAISCCSSPSDPCPLRKQPLCSQCLLNTETWQVAKFQVLSSSYYQVKMPE